MIIVLFMVLLMFTNFKSISSYHLNKCMFNKKLAVFMSNSFKNKYYIIGNWKMNTNSSTSAKLAKEITINKNLALITTGDKPSDLARAPLAPPISNQVPII